MVKYKSKGVVPCGNKRAKSQPIVILFEVVLTSIKLLAVIIFEAKNSSSLSVQLVRMNEGITSVKM